MIKAFCSMYLASMSALFCALVLLTSCGDAEQCTPNCFQKECGDDGCGGLCGACAAGEECLQGICVPECEGDLVSCGGECVDTSSNDDHCGGCGIGCWPDEVCEDGVCVRDDECTPDCDGRECGDDGCGGVCGECGDGEVCSGGVCVAGCEEGLTDCDGACVDLLSDEENCGDCGVVCEDDEVCEDGECVEANGDDTTVLAAWESSCVDEGSSAAPSTSSPENDFSELTVHGARQTASHEFHTFVCVSDAFSTRHWNNEEHEEKYWQVTASTLGHEDLRLFSKQSGSNTGPRHFSLEYSVDGSNWIDAGLSLELANDWESAVVEDHPLPFELEDQAEIFIRWILDEGSPSIGGDEIGTVGTSRINDVIIRGSPL